MLLVLYHGLQESHYFILLLFFVAWHVLVLSFVSCCKISCVMQFTVFSAMLHNFVSVSCVCGCGRAILITVWMCEPDIHFEVRSCKIDSTREEIIVYLTGLLGRQC